MCNLKCLERFEAVHKISSTFSGVVENIIYARKTPYRREMSKRFMFWHLLRNVDKIKLHWDRSGNDGLKKAIIEDNVCDEMGHCML